MRDEEPDDGLMVEGVFAAIAAMVVAGALAWALSSKAPWLALAFLYVGVTQAVYLLPVILIFHYWRRPRAILGVLLFAAIIFILNASCFVLVVAHR
jgi:hypothetical protein